MWRSLISGIALAVGLSSAAHAYGFSEHDKQSAWTGCSVGGHLGAAWGREAWASAPSDTSIIRTDINEFLFSSDLRPHEITGILGGPRAGCDYQASPGRFQLGKPRR